VADLERPAIRPRRPLLLAGALAALIVVLAGTLVVILSSWGGSGPRAGLSSRGGAAARAGHPRLALLRPKPAPPTPPISRLLGQLIVARFSGARPSSAFLARIRTGQLGGVILFADNTAGGLDLTRHTVQRLQHAARHGGNPPLLVMTDQEGGSIRRLPGPPELAPSEMPSDATALREGQLAGKLLRSIGVNVDLAPVADVERIRGSFLGTRSFGESPALVSARSCAFARGLASQGVAYTLKHFPGLGRAVTTTDAGPVSIAAPPSAIRDDYGPYLTCASGPLALVMVSSAAYPDLSGPLPAVMSPMIYQRELRIAGAGATISDDLQAPALAGLSSPARHGINAGLDLAMYAQTEQASANAYLSLLADVRSGHIDVPRVREAARAVQALKRSLGGG
jgi:beta-N-acetylhexosaminidase